MIGTTASASAREVVRYNAEVQPGTIVVKTAERWLYLVLGNGSAIRYTVADNPKLPDVIPGGAPNNPMGVAAMTLSGGEDAIHGTKRPDSIGKFASYSCIRMLNQDISDLFDRVDVGTQVVVLR
jgi:lipoprotein-anchoring transpeptidase ErfK/SrfK